MFFKISAFLPILQVILATDSSKGYNFTDGEIIATHIYDNDDLKPIQEGLHLMQTMSANLRLKIDSLEMTLNQQRNELMKDLEELKAAFTTQKNELKNDFEEIKSALTSQKESIIDIRDELHQQATTQTNALKRDLEEIKSALTIQKESIKSIDSEKINLTDIRGEINEQATRQTNELKKDLQEIRASLFAQKELFKSIDSSKTNLTDIRGELCPQLTIQNNEIKKDLELKAATIRSLPTNCAEALKESGQTGIYKIEIPYVGFEPFNAYCLKDSPNDTSAWLVIQRRQDGSVDFNRNWTEYQDGFGNLGGEFFIGLNKLHALTQLTTQELWIQMETFKGKKRWAKYSNFTVGSESESYALNNLGNYTGDAGNVLSHSKGMKWSTFDRDNDECKGSCARNMRGAFWYKHCSKANLNGRYFRNVNGEDWKHMHSRFMTRDPLKYVHRAIRPIQ